jgi:hypothetical protein
MNDERSHPDPEAKVVSDPQVPARGVTLADEYNSLRTEMLQVREQQDKLIFTTAVAVFAIVAAAVFKGDIKSEPLKEFLPVVPLFWELMLICVAMKSKANYKHLYAVGSYVTIVHECKGGREEKSPTIVSQPAWHFLSRKLGKNPTWKWGSGATVDFYFLLVFGLIGVTCSAVLWILHCSCLSCLLFQNVLWVFGVFLYVAWPLRRTKTWIEDLEKCITDELEKLAEGSK